MSRTPDRRIAPALAAAVVVLVTAIVFLPVRNFGFVSWDDDVYVTKNPLVQAPLAVAAPRILTQFVSGNYHPLTIASYALDRELFGDGAGAHHIVNLALHLANAVLVLRLLTALGTPLAAAAAAALLWAVHPLRAEPVAWISGRKDLLAALCSLGSILSYLDYRKSGRPRALALSAALLALALLAKATAAAVPGLLLAIEWLQGRRITLAAVRDKLPHLALVGVFSVVAVLARQDYQGVLGEQAFGWRHLVFQGTFRGTFYFLLRSLVPLANPGWLYPDASRPLLLSGHFFAAVGLLAAVAVIAVVSLRATRKISFGLLFFLIAVLPALPVSVLGFSADRFTYLPAVGLAYLCGEAFGRLSPRGSTGGVRRAIAGAVGVAALALLFAVRTRGAVAAWADSESLWTEAVRQYTAHGVSGRNLSLAHAYRARARLEAGGLAGALADYAEAARLDPGSAELRNEHGIALASEGAYAEALAEFTAALELEPDSGAAAFNRGLARLALGDGAEAAGDFTRAMASDPSNTAALLGRAKALLLLGNPSGAARDAEAFRRLHPDDPEALELLDDVRRAGSGAPGP